MCSFSMLLCLLLPFEMDSPGSSAIPLVGMYCCNQTQLHIDAEGWGKHFPTASFEQTKGGLSSPSAFCDAAKPREEEDGEKEEGEEEEEEGAGERERESRGHFGSSLPTIALLCGVVGPQPVGSSGSAFRERYLLTLHT